jgi:hypothetical protein
MSAGSDPPLVLVDGVNLAPNRLTSYRAGQNIGDKRSTLVQRRRISHCNKGGCRPTRSLVCAEPGATSGSGTRQAVPTAICAKRCRLVVLELPQLRLRFLQLLGRGVDLCAGPRGLEFVLGFAQPLGPISPVHCRKLERLAPLCPPCMSREDSTNYKPVTENEPGSRRVEAAPRIDRTTTRTKFLPPVIPVAPAPCPGARGVAGGRPLSSR